MTERTVASVHTDAMIAAWDDEADLMATWGIRGMLGGAGAMAALWLLWLAGALRLFPLEPMVLLTLGLPLLCTLCGCVGAALGSGDDG